VQVGDVVLRDRNPFGFGNTVTLGIVSALGAAGSHQPYEDFIQTGRRNQPRQLRRSADRHFRRLIGINSTIYSRSAAAVGRHRLRDPVSLARDVLAQIIEKGEVTRGWFGIEPQDVDDEIARVLSLPRPEGVLIRGVQRGGRPTAPASRWVTWCSTSRRATRDTPALLTRIAELRRARAPA